MPFVRGFVLLLVVFLTLYIFIVGGIGCACICGLVVDWERLYFGFGLCRCVFILCFVCFCCWCGALALNEDIIRFRCGGGEVTFCTYFYKIFKFFYNFS